jgi:hypothetical protein
MSSKHAQFVVIGMASGVGSRHMAADPQWAEEAGNSISQSQGKSGVSVRILAIGAVDRAMDSNTLSQIITEVDKSPPKRDVLAPSPE